ncbi:MAG: preprotein translocase subunit SecG [Ruminococcaceae bacterium]|nr:preprotein translocase subunit SecG [Oscillospiraceae bacterium]
MQALEWVMGISILVMAVFLVIAVLLQSGKDKKLSGTITGGSETYLSKSKGHSRDKILSIATTVVAIVFSVLVVAMYVIVAGMY